MGEDGAQDSEIPRGDRGALDDGALVVLDDLGLAGAFEAHPEPRSRLFLRRLDWGDGGSGFWRQIAAMLVVGGARIRVRVRFGWDWAHQERRSPGGSRLLREEGGRLLPVCPRHCSPPSTAQNKERKERRKGVG